MDAAGRQPQKKKSPPKVAGLLGLGLDGDDGTKRITRGKNFLLAGGSEETHGKMQETAIKLNERLDKQGRRLSDVPVNELRDMIDEVRPQ
ncbi:MAG: hypothetical protein CMJ58_03000 [Planctomycetaceae bacterium]|nr:hypothetical protein [Planctomycetaceae bacterium]